MMFSFTHFFLLLLCGIAIGRFVNRADFPSKEAVRKRIKACTFLLWGLEIGKNIFYILVGDHKELLDSLPLYYCSLTLYCGLFSVYAKGHLKKTGDIFIEVGGLVGGIGYLLSPCSTAGSYPAFHFITINSFMYHTIMVYMSLIMIKMHYNRFGIKDVGYYAAIIVLMSILAYGVNQLLHTNFMFISENFPGTPMELLYKLSPFLFPIIITFFQAVPPFFVLYYFLKWWERKGVEQHRYAPKEK